MTIIEAIEEIESITVDPVTKKNKLSTADVLVLAEKLRSSVNDAFELGRLDATVVG